MSPLCKRSRQSTYIHICLRCFNSFTSVGSSWYRPCWQGFQLRDQQETPYLTNNHLQCLRLLALLQALYNAVSLGALTAGMCALSKTITGLTLPCQDPWLQRA